MLCSLRSFMRCASYRVANIARREEKVAASSFRAFSSFLSFIMVSVTMAFSFSYLLFRLAKATSAVCERTRGREELDQLGNVILPSISVGDGYFVIVSSCNFGWFACTSNQVERHQPRDIFCQLCIN